MTDLKISELAAVTDLLSGDALPLARSSESKKITGANFLAGLLALMPDLAAVEGLTSVADRLAYFTGANAASLATLTSAARSLLDDSDASAMLSTLGASTFIKTLLDDSDAATARATLGAGGTELNFKSLSADKDLQLAGPAAANAIAILTSDSISLDGSTRICIEFQGTASSGNNTVYVELYEDSTSLGIICTWYHHTTSFYAPWHCRRYRTPSNGSHTYTVKGWHGNTSSSYSILGSSGWTAFLRIATV